MNAAPQALDQALSSLRKYNIGFKEFGKKEWCKLFIVVRSFEPNYNTFFSRCMLFCKCEAVITFSILHGRSVSLTSLDSVGGALLPLVPPLEESEVVM